MAADQDNSFTFVDAVASTAGPGQSLVELGYRIGSDTDLVERIELPFELPDTPEVRSAVAVLHLAAGVSYYKSVAPTTLITPALSAAQRLLVEALYDQGLREFAYRNQIRVPLPVRIDESITGDIVRLPTGNAPATVLDGGRALVPIGGGKDSALVASLVPDGHLFAVNPVGAHRHLAEALGRPLMGVRRTLDPLLRDMVARGAPNGHVPVTAITSAIAVLAATALGLDDVLMGIERSADEPSLVTTDGVAVNHQFSKSYEAELLLREAFRPTGVCYLSLLRPMSELAIGTAVARRGLGDDIVSCNRVFTVWNENTSSREQRPCGECAKCLFTALMVSPSSTPGAVERQYGRALLDAADHVAPVRDLWSSEKPFDCVGERLESAAAIKLLSGMPEWRDQAVIAALAPEARALLDDAGVDPAEFFELGPLDVLPERYRSVVGALGPDLAEAPGVDGAAR